MSKANKRERQKQNREQRRAYEEQLAKRRRRWKTARNFAIFLVPVIVIGVILSITNSSDSKSAAGGCADVSTPKAKPASTLSAPTGALDPNQTYTATIETTCGTIQADLYSQQYPISAKNFDYLATQGYFDGLAVNRVAKNFVVQTGSPQQTTVGGAGYTVAAEKPTDTKPYPVGTLAWAKTGSDPAGSVSGQFFIVTGSQASTLPPDYAVIGKITKGLDVAKTIGTLAPSSGDGPPTKPVVMKKVTITTGVTAPTSTTPSS